MLDLMVSSLGRWIILVSWHQRYGLRGDDEGLEELAVQKRITHDMKKVPMRSSTIEQRSSNQNRLLM
jgi:hypothetical protein